MAESVRNFKKSDKKIKHQTKDENILVDNKGQGSMIFF